MASFREEQRKMCKKAKCMQNHWP